MSLSVYHFCPVKESLFLGNLVESLGPKCKKFCSKARVKICYFSWNLQLQSLLQVCVNQLDGVGQTNIQLWHIAQLELSIAGISSIVVVLFPTDHQGVKGWPFAWAEVWSLMLLTSLVQEGLRLTCHGSIAFAKSNEWRVILKMWQSHFLFAQIILFFQSFSSLIKSVGLGEERTVP